MTWATRSAVALVAVVALSGCGGGSDDVPPALEQARTDLLQGIGVLPLPGRSGADLATVKVKFDPPYLTASGRLAVSPDRVTAYLTDAVRRAGFTVVPPTPPAPVAAAGVVEAVRDDVRTMVVAYQRLGVLEASSGEVFVQLSVQSVASG